MSDAGLWSLLIPAVGGQGGGVLAEWIVEAATADGYLAHGTSIPGVAQRTGSTTYYVEIVRSHGGAAEPTFSLYPVPGALDVLLAPEFLEVGRAIELGFPSPERTTIIASTQRLYSIHEKLRTGRGIYPMEQLRAGARAFSRALIAVDALALAREHSTEANAVLLGALAGSGVLPIRAEAYRRAIEAKGVQVEANLRGFGAGLRAAERSQAGGGEVPALKDDTSPGTSPPPAPAPQRAQATARLAEVGPEIERLVAGFPEALGTILDQAIARLVDYQDRAYALRYLRRLEPFANGDPELARIVARHLAVWMTYEDAIRVADLKTRARRFDRIRREVGAPGAEIVVTDFLKPDLDELYGILPHRLVASLARWAERRWPHGRPTLGQHVRTTTVTGYLRLWLLARLRRLRPISYRAHLEHARMERWLEAVRECARRDVDLARAVARAAQLVKGYGDVRRRMAACVDHLLASALRAAELETAAGRGVREATEFARRYRTLVLEGPEGEPEARRLADDVLTRLGTAAAASAPATRSVGAR